MRRRGDDEQPSTASASWSSVRRCAYSGAATISSARELGVENQMMLCALGLKEDGAKEMLSFHLVDQEDTDSWRAFPVDLKGRRLPGQSPEAHHHRWESLSLIHI